jgi:hypothetical protein
VRATVVLHPVAAANNENENVAVSQGLLSAISVANKTRP